MKHLRAFCTPVLMLLFLQTQSSNAQGAGEAVPLIYKFEKGKTYRYLTQAETQSSQTMMGREMTTTSKITSASHLAIEEVDAGSNVTYVSSTDSLVIELHTPQRDTTIVNPFGIVGKRTREKVSNHGKLISSTPIDTVQAPMGMGRYGRGASALLMDFGGETVKVGDTWNHTRADTSEQMGGKTIVTFDLTFTAVETTTKLGHNCLKISYKGTMAIEGSGTMMGTNVYTEGTGTVTGTSHFAPKEGLLVESESTMDQEMTAAVTGQQAMTIPISQTITSTTRLVE